MTKRPHPRSLAEWRDERQLNQADAAKFLKISQPAYSRYERRERIPKRPVLERIIARTGMTADEILGLAS